MERSVAELVGETDVEALTAEEVVETVLERLDVGLADELCDAPLHRGNGTSMSDSYRWN
jgi:hypothetical protein